MVEERGECYAGVLEQVDLLSFLSSQSYILGLQDRAGRVPSTTCRSASDSCATLVQVLYGHGTKIPFVTQLVAELTRRSRPSCSR